MNRQILRVGSSLSQGQGEGATCSPLMRRMMTGKKIMEGCLWRYVGRSLEGSLWRGLADPGTVGQGLCSRLQGAGIALWKDVQSRAEQTHSSQGEGSTWFLSFVPVLRHIQLEMDRHPGEATPASTGSRLVARYSSYSSVHSQIYHPRSQGQLSPPAWSPRSPSFLLLLPSVHLSVSPTGL